MFLLCPPLFLLFLRWWSLLLSLSPPTVAAAADLRLPRALGEHCDDAMEFPCELGLQCILLVGKGRTCRTPTTADMDNNDDSDDDGSDRCLHVKCPIVFPDCPLDTVPVLLQSVDEEEQQQPASKDSAAAECCPSLVKCQCDPKKCLIPACPEGTERMLVQLGSERPGECCDQFECRQTEIQCENVRCPDSADTLDLYSSDGLSCPSDSYRPAPYVPPGACCPIISQCTCRPGICEPARQCSANELLVVRRRGGGEPGKCCDEFECRATNQSQESDEGCRHGDRFFSIGERWHSALCQECQCGSGGISKCRRMECPKIAHGCTWVGIVPGECCPMCLGCRDENGITYAQGDHWDRDECTNCTCLDFGWQCQKFICKTDCENPKNVPGECCPFCEEPTVVKPPFTYGGCPSLQQCPLRCEFGLVQKQLSGCFECECAQVNKMGGGGGNGVAIGQIDEQTDERRRTKCELLTERNCARLCAHGYLRDQNGCSICRCAHCPPMNDRCAKLCVFGFESNSVGCSICKCRTETAAAAASDIAALQNVSTAPFYHTVPTDSPLQYASVSPSSLHCLSDEGERDIGEWWTDFECWHCFCQHGKEFCSLIACPNRPDECSQTHWTRSSESQCCPSCVPSIESVAPNSSSLSPSTQQWHFSQVCHSPGTGQLFVDGETWHLNGCVACTCRMGHVLCSWNDGKKCPPAPCDGPLLEPAVDPCCPRCPPGDEQSPAPIASDVTVEHLLLSANNCVDTQNGNIYGTGAEWRRDLCHSCRCLSNGKVRCAREQCSAQLGDFGGCVSGRMLSLKGRCCPICSDALGANSAPAAVCTYGSTIFARGEQFRDGPCRNCTCLEAGIIRCTEIHCPSCRDERQKVANNGTAADDKDTCCSLCRVNPSEDSPPAVVMYSSFELGSEDHVMFIGDNGGDEQNARDVPSLSNWLSQRRHVQLLGAIVASLLAALCCLFTAFVLAGRKCRVQKATALKKLPAGVLNGTTYCFPKTMGSVQLKQQQWKSNCERGGTETDDGEMGTSLLLGTISTTTTTVSTI